nr:hypothetical protein [Deltaproteobacteria bacterium]
MEVLAAVEALSSISATVTRAVSAGRLLREVEGLGCPPRGARGRRRCREGVQGLPGGREPLLGGLRRVEAARTA